MVRYVSAALRVIADPRDDLYKEAFLGVVLPKTLRDVVKAEAEANCEAPIDRLRRMSRELPGNLAPLVDPGSSPVWHGR